LKLLLPRNAILGTYSTNGFCIRISDQVPLIDKKTERFHPNNLHDYAIFIHEYWHYVVNISTFTGVKDFRILQSLIPHFSDTLQTHANGIVDSGFLNTDACRFLSATMTLYSEILGQQECQNVSDYINDFKILNYHIEDIKVNLENKEAPCTKINLEISIDTVGGTINSSFEFGTYAMDEGLAYEIQSMIDKNAQVPLIPYHVLRKLSEFIIGHEISKYELCGITTLALLTVNAPKALIKMLEEYNDISKQISNPINRLEMLWQSFILPQSTDAIKAVENDLSEWLNLYKDRGLLEKAIEFLGNKYIEFLKRREKEPLFDLEAFIENTCNLDKLHNLVNDVIPCDIIQEYPGDDMHIGKDRLYSFGVNLYQNNSQYKPTDFLRTLECQLHYLCSHLTNNGFVDSNQINAEKCPFYTICELPGRTTNPTICEENPWLVHHDNNKTCWYGSAVNATIGTIKL
jgi:hypothetical protein